MSAFRRWRIVRMVILISVAGGLVWLAVWLGPSATKLGEAMSKAAQQRELTP
jgi:ferric-dicitrate binding protein FerR (iron transport regulator)